MLSAGMALRWLRGILGQRPLFLCGTGSRGGEVEPGFEGLTFLHYIVGERSPIMDARAKGGFIGLALHTARAIW
jgi:xylulokinase